MVYKLERASINNLDLLIKYKLDTILEYSSNLSKEELEKIKSYINSQVPKQIDNYKIIKVEDKIIGCLLVYDYLDGKLLDEIFIEEAYRNNYIGTNIIKNILNSNNIVYLWVYKDNVKAQRLYKRLGFVIKEEKDTRYCMKYEKFERARKFCLEVKELAKKYDLPFFVVTDGASATSNNGCEAVKNARKNHEKWEVEHGFDPEEDWSK